MAQHENCISNKNNNYYYFISSFYTHRNSFTEIGPNILNSFALPNENMYKVLIKALLKIILFKLKIKFSEYFHFDLYIPTYLYELHKL